MKLEFTTTACVRPELLDQTYSSLNKALIDVDLKTEGVLYINIDPVPDSSEQAINEELEVARSHFSEVHHRVGESGGNFSRAASWVLSQPTGEYFFNVEDDWLYYGKIRIQDYINKIKLDDRDNILQCVASNILTRKSIRKIDNRIYLAPSLFQTSIIQSMLTQHPIPENENPERWLWEIKDTKRLVDYNVVCMGGVSCKDNGRKWMRSKGLSKNQNNKRVNDKLKIWGNFTRWNLK